MLVKGRMYIYRPPGEKYHGLMRFTGFDNQDLQGILFCSVWPSGRTLSGWDIQYIKGVYVPYKRILKDLL